MFGLATGGFVFLAFLLVYTLSIARCWRQQPIVVRQPAPSGLRPLLAQADDAAQFPASQPAGPASDGQRRPRQLSTRELILILLAAIGIATWSEFTLITLMTEDVGSDIRAALLGLVIAGALFVFVSKRVDPPSVPAPFKAIVPERFGPPAALWITNLALTFVLLDSIDRELPVWTNYPILGIWLANILLFCWNVYKLANVPFPSREALAEWWRTHRLDVLLVVALGLAALLLRVIDLELYPYSFINDEGEVGLEAMSILRGEKTTFFATGWAGQPLVSFLSPALSVHLLGNTGFAIRLVSALQGTLAVVFLYLLGREVFNRPVGLSAAILLAAMPWHVHFSRLGVFNISDSLFSTGALWLTYRALRRGTYLAYLPAGLMTGFALYSYVGGRLVIPMVFGVLAYAIVRQRDYLRTHFRHLAIIVLAFLIVAAPIMMVFLRHNDEFMGRLNTESLLTNNRLQELADAASMKPEDFFLRQVQDSTMIFVAMPGPGQFFDTPRPYLPWWAAIFFIFGMAYALWRFKEVRYMLLLGWFWAPVLIGSALTFFPPSHQRMLSAAPALALLVAIGLWKLAHTIQHIGRHIPSKWVTTACLLVVGLTAAQDIHFYFLGQFRTEHHFEIAGNEFSYEVSMRARALGPGHQLLLIGDPDIYAEFANFHYLSPNAAVKDFNTVDVETISALPRERGYFFAAIPERADELRLVADTLPGGEWIEVPRRTQEGISYYGYIVPPPSNVP